MPQERVYRFRVPCLRGLDPALRRARLLAAREAQAGYSQRRGILSGSFDGGHLVRRFMEGQGNGNEGES